MSSMDPDENPPAKLLLEAGEAGAALFERSGYKRMASERSQVAAQA
jgi:hypothetical protein